MFVTGLPGSGTSWAYAVLSHFYDTPEDVFWASGRKGGEWEPLRRYSLSMIRGLLGEVEPSAAPWPIDGARRREWIDSHPLPALPGLVKSPDWGVCRLYEEYPTPSVLMVRPMDSWLDSVSRNRRTLSIDRRQLAEGAERAIGVMAATADVLVEWPKVLFDPDVLSAAVGFDVAKAAAEVTNPDWVSC